MKRLTMYIDKSVYYSNNGNPILPVEMLDTPFVREVLRRLAEYEDIGLTPDVIKYRLEENNHSSVISGVDDLKGYKIYYGTFGCTSATIYCLAQSEEKAKEYISNSMSCTITAIEEISAEKIPVSELSAGDIMRLIK